MNCGERAVGFHLQTGIAEILHRLIFYSDTERQQPKKLTYFIMTMIEMWLKAMALFERQT